MSSNQTIKISNLCKSFPINNLKYLQSLLLKGKNSPKNSIPILKNISFGVNKGEVVGIVGRNGSGKSTLLKIIAGTLNYDSGTTNIKGSVSALLELGAGFHHDYTGEQNTYMYGAYLGLSNNEIDKLMPEIQKFADIGDYFYKPLKLYSSGMHVRLAFSVFSFIRADVLILDEAMAVGDEKFQRQCFEKIKYLKETGCTILFVSHNPQTIISLCDRAYILDNGEIIYSGSPADTINNYQTLIYKNINDQELFKDELIKKEIKIIKQKNNQFYLKKFNIQNTRGKKPNLISGKYFDINITGKFKCNIKNISINIFIRNNNDLGLIGLRFPENGKYIEDIRVNDSVSITFPFHNNLLPGKYFLGYSIWSDYNTKRIVFEVDKIEFIVPDLSKNFNIGLIYSGNKTPRFEKN